MQKIRGILRVGFEIAFLVIISFGTFLRITRAAERVPPRAAKSAGKHPNHLGAEWGRRRNGLGIRRRKACLGMPTDGGR